MHSHSTVLKAKLVKEHNFPVYAILEGEGSSSAEVEKTMHNHPSLPQA